MLYGIKSNKCLEQIPQVKASYQLTFTNIAAGEVKSNLATASKYRNTDHVIITLKASDVIDVSCIGDVFNSSCRVCVKNTSSTNIPTITVNVLVLGYEST